MMMATLILFSFLLVTVSATVDVKVGIINLPGNFNLLISEVFLVPAAEIAIKAVAKRVEDGQYKNFNMTFISSNEGRYPVRSAGAVAASFHHNHGVDAFIGPPDSFDTIPVADMAAYWNIPIVSGVSTSTLLHDKTRFQTFTRTAPGISLLVNLMLALSEGKEWRNCVILRAIRPSDGIYYNHVIPTALFETLEANGVTVIEIFANKFSTLDEALKQAASISEGKKGREEEGM